MLFRTTIAVAIISVSACAGLAAGRVLGIERDAILESVESFEILEAYPEDKYLPSYLVYADPLVMSSTCYSPRTLLATMFGSSRRIGQT